MFYNVTSPCNVFNFYWYVLYKKKGSTKFDITFFFTSCEEGNISSIFITSLLYKLDTLLLKQKKYTIQFYPVPDLPLCLGVLKHRAPLAWGLIFLSKHFFTMDFAYVVQF